MLGWIKSRTTLIAICKGCTLECKGSILSAKNEKWNIGRIIKRGES